MAEFLIDIRSLCLHRIMLVVVVHFFVESHEAALPVLDYLEGHNERNWDEVRENQDPSARLLDKQKEPVGVPDIVFVETEVGRVIKVIDHPSAADCRTNHGSNDLNDEDLQNFLVGLSGNVRHFVDRTSRVHLDL